MYLELEVINKIAKPQLSLQLSKIFFCCTSSLRVEQFTDHVVDVNSLKQFETRLDKFWKDQDVMFDWTAEITGTGDRSEFKLETVLESTI